MTAAGLPTAEWGTAIRNNGKNVINHEGHEGREERQRTALTPANDVHQSALIFYGYVEGVLEPKPRKGRKRVAHGVSRGNGRPPRVQPRKGRKILRWRPDLP